MTFPTAVSNFGANLASNGTSMNVNLDTRVVDDMFFVFIAWDGNPSGISLPTATGCDPWTQLFYVNSAGLTSAGCWYTKCTTNASQHAISVTWTGSEQAAYRVYNVTGADTATAPEAATLATTGSFSSLDPPSLDPAGWGVEDTAWLSMATFDNGSRTVTASPTTPSGFQFSTSNISTGTGGVGLLTALYYSATASLDPAAWTISNADDRLAATVAIRTFGGGGPLTIDETGIGFTVAATVSLGNVSHVVFATEALSLTGAATVTGADGMGYFDLVLPITGTATLTETDLLVTDETVRALTGTATLSEIGTVAYVNPTLEALGTVTPTEIGTVDFVNPTLLASVAATVTGTDGMGYFDLVTSLTVTATLSETDVTVYAEAPSLTGTVTLTSTDGVVFVETVRSLTATVTPTSTDVVVLTETLVLTGTVTPTSTDAGIYSNLESAFTIDAFLTGTDASVFSSLDRSLTIDATLSSIMPYFPEVQNLVADDEYSPNRVVLTWDEVTV